MKVKNLGQEDKIKYERTRKYLQIAVGIIVLLASIFLTIWIYPKIMSFSDPIKRAELETEIRSSGLGGWFIMLGIQILQVVIAMIPGEPVEIFSGVLYGAFGGIVTCMIGIFIGTVIVYTLVKRLGLPLVSCFVDPDEIGKLWFLKDEKRFQQVALLLFFIPGTPKDLLTYGVCLSWTAKQASKQNQPSNNLDISNSMAINPWKFFLLSTIARLPSILTSTLLGASLIEGNFKTSVLVFLVTALISLVGILFHKWLTNHKNRRVNE